MFLRWTHQLTKDAVSRNPNLIRYFYRTPSLTRHAHQLRLVSLVVLCIGLNVGCQTLNPFRTNRSRFTESNHWITGGREALSDGRLEEAEECLERAVKFRPNDPGIREELAKTLLLQGKNAAAVEHLANAIEDSGGDSRLHVSLGQAYLANGQLNLASRQADLAIAGNRKLPEAWALRGEIKLAKRNVDGSLADFQRALSLEWNLPHVQKKVAQLHLANGEPMRSLSMLEKMLADYPPDHQPEDVLVLAGRALLELGQPDQAVTKLRLATAREGSTADSFVALCEAQIACGQLSNARSTLTTACQKFPENRPAFERLLTSIQSARNSIASSSTAAEFVR
jgi:Tfp pilus assembly protein PilF